MLFAIRLKGCENGESFYTRGGSNPKFGREAHLYRTKGLAEGMLKRYRAFANCEVVEVELKVVPNQW